MTIKMIPAGEICEFCFQKEAIAYTAGNWYCKDCIPKSYWELEEWDPETYSIRLAAIHWGYAKVIK